MPPVGFQPGVEKSLWWKVALHLDETQIALANASAHNVDDPRLINALYDKLREGQGILLEILTVKGFMPNGTNGRHDVPPPVMSEPAVPEQMITDAEIIDDAPPPAAGGYTEGYAAQGSADPGPIVGYSSQATTEPPAVSAEPVAAEPEASAEAQPLVPPDSQLPQQTAVAAGERAE
ncbi:MAG TPA: hypothetical protein VLE97_05930 [Gaiellaceae bacterium]|nr:hypothetical protein [Gaiellaceae bacterium]